MNASKLPDPTAAPGPDLLRGLLRDVSRTFYRTLQILPGAVRRPIGLGYLLARATDTVADTELVPVQTRLEALEELTRRIDGSRTQPLNFRSWVGTSEQAHAEPTAEIILLLRIEEAIGVLQSLSPADQGAVREVLRTITSGQILDLRRFGAASSERIVALKNGAELDDYTYRVAGCVGEFWTQLCRRHLFPSYHVDESALLAEALRFGQGLQLVNILRDLPRDLRQGRCYLPSDELNSAGLAPADLLDPSNMSRLHPVYRCWLDKAKANLVAGWRYTNRLPFNQKRLRLACAWPILIGFETLDRLYTVNILDVAQRVKISRRAVRNIMLRTVWRLPFRKSWERLGSPS